MTATITLAASLLLSYPGAVDRPTVIAANHWFNPYTIQLPDERTYVLLFFSTRDDEGAIEKNISRLNKLASKKDLVVVGLSAEPADRVKAFIEKHGIRFAVGAESKASRQFHVERFPTVLLLDPRERAAGGQPWVMTSAQLDDYLEFTEAQSFDIADRWDENGSVELLQEHARSGPDDPHRKQALELLRARMDAPDFMSLCDELLETAEGTAWRGDIAYQRHLADPTVAQKQPYVAPSVEARRARREHPESPEWQSVRDYEAVVAGRSIDQLVADFFDHQDQRQDRANLLIRREIASRFNAITDDGTAEEKALARTQLMQMLPGEPDSAVRLWLVGALWAACAPGDLEVADFLEKQLEAEPDIRTVRPMMETVIRCMRTGEGPCDNEE